MRQEVLHSPCWSSLGPGENSLGPGGGAPCVWSSPLLEPVRWYPMGP